MSSEIFIIAWLQEKVIERQVREKFSGASLPALCLRVNEFEFVTGRLCKTGASAFGLTQSQSMPGGALDGPVRLDTDLEAGIV